MLDPDSLNLPALTTAHTRTKTTKQFPGQRTAQPHLRALLRNAAMDRTASVRTGEYVLPSRRRGQVVLMEKSASRLSKRRALGAWEFGRSMTNSPTARSLIGLSGLFAGLCATFALIFSILEGWQEHIQKCWPQVSATIDRYIPLRRRSAHT